LGLASIAAQFKPNAADRWIVAPADLPTLGTKLINQLIAASIDTESIVVPRFGDRRGHPVSFPWSLAEAVSQLGVNQGINHLLESHPVRWLELSAQEHPHDIDTPEDYLRLWKGQNPT
jgi:molybdenum cofactor cytidylyltransferase